MTANTATCCHADEPYYTPATAETDGLLLTPEQVVLTRNVLPRWAEFAWTGNPNHAGRWSSERRIRGDNEFVMNVTEYV